MADVAVGRDGVVPRLGARRVDDRRVLSGIAHILRFGCRWQDSPAAYGPPTTIYNHFHLHRWAGRGLWQKLFDALVEANPADMWMIDSTTVKAHRSAAGGKGGANASDRPLAGGRTMKIHVLVDDRGRPLNLRVSPRQMGDIKAAVPLLDCMSAAYFLIADTAYDSDCLRQYMPRRKNVPVIPHNPTRKRKHPFDERLAADFKAAILIAAIVIWWAI
ncbi:IS5 family transposase [Shinella sp. BYT-45]|uniref:IS5 family transposase n=1 Tax=Shinella sp. BYT-45 TaxID=3377377 RepID=UPI00397FFC59